MVSEGQMLRLFKSVVVLYGVTLYNSKVACPRGAMDST